MADLDCGLKRGRAPAAARGRPCTLHCIAYERARPRERLEMSNSKQRVRVSRSIFRRKRGSCAAAVAIRPGRWCGRCLIEFGDDAVRQLFEPDDVFL